MSITTSGLVPFVFSALGMLAGHWLGRSTLLRPIEASAAAAELSVTRFELVDGQGRRTILMDTVDDRPSIWFFDKNGKARLNLGLYADDNAFIVLNDDRERAVQIFRTRGPESAPFLVMKSGGRDRIVMGLAGAAQDPFLVHFDPAGRKRTVFGSDR